jgi:hypothetical protein
MEKTFCDECGIELTQTKFHISVDETFVTRLPHTDEQYEALLYKNKDLCKECYKKYNIFQ